MVKYNQMIGLKWLTNSAYDKSSKKI